MGGTQNSPTPVAAIHIIRCACNDNLMSMPPVRDLASAATTYRDKASTSGACGFHVGQRRRSITQVLCTAEIWYGT